MLLYYRYVPLSFTLLLTAPRNFPPHYSGLRQ
jgi:hypothetical protein